MAQLPNSDIVLSEHEQDLLREMKKLHDDKTTPKYELKTHITQEMRDLAIRLGCPEFAFMKPIQKISEEKPEDLDAKTKAENSRAATKFSKQISQDVKVVHICNKCGKKANSACGKCGKVWYCSRDCQVANWSSHKPKCVPSAPKPAEPITPKVVTD